MNSGWKYFGGIVLRVLETFWIYRVSFHELHQSIVEKVWLGQILNLLKPRRETWIKYFLDGATNGSSKNFYQLAYLKWHYIYSFYILVFEILSSNTLIHCLPTLTMLRITNDFWIYSTPAFPSNQSSFIVWMYIINVKDNFTVYQCIITLMYPAKHRKNVHLQLFSLDNYIISLRDLWIHILL